METKEKKENGTYLNLEQARKSIKEKGDKLFNEGKYAESLEKFLENPHEGPDNRTLLVDPSVVIEKFLGKNLFSYLPSYLRKLHEKHPFNTDHTKFMLMCLFQSVVLKCLSKQDLTEEYNALVNFMSHSQDLQLDVLEILPLLKRFGFREVALRLAYQFGAFEIVIELEVEDYRTPKNQNNYRRALNHLEKLESEEIQRVLTDHLHVLLREIPRETTAFLIRFCLGKNYVSPEVQRKESHSRYEKKRRSFSFFKLTKRYKCPLVSSSNKDGSGLKSPKSKCDATGGLFANLTSKQTEISCESIVKHFSDNRYLCLFLEALFFCSDAKFRNHSLSSRIFNTMMELYFRFSTMAKSMSDSERKDENESVYSYPISESGSETKIEIDPNLLIYGCFHPSEHIREMAEETNNDDELTAEQIRENRVLFRYNKVSPQLSKMKECMNSWMEIVGHVRSMSICEKVKVLLRFSFIDMQQVLVLLLIYNECPLSKDPEIVDKIYSELSLSYDLVQYYMSNGEMNRVKEISRRVNERALYILALRYLVDMYSNDAERTEPHLKALLTHLAKSDLLSPLDVIKLLSKEESIRIRGVAEEYLSRKYSSMKMRVRRSTNVISSKKNRIDVLENNVLDLTERGTLFNLSGKNCDACGLKISKYPMIIFMCSHSFHESCLSVSDIKCSLCSADHERIIKNSH